MNRPGQAVFITSPVFVQPAWGASHPLAIGRQKTLHDLCTILGWLPDSATRIARAAPQETLLRFHTGDYLHALRQSCDRGKVSTMDRQRYHIGTMENPAFPGLYERAATSVGGAVLAAQCALKGHTAFHPAGGTHHGRPDRASGFCYFNDPVFALLTLLDAGMERVLYVDLDAHHGDGVQDAFAEERRIMTISVHEQNRWPHSGALEDRGGGQARNLPVPAGFHDAELDFLLTKAILPLAKRFAPHAVVITCGADALAGDPLSHLGLGNGALWRAVQALAALTSHAVVLGGGGYNPWTVARLWAGLWGLLSGQPLPEPLPPDAQALLAALECDLVDEEDLRPHWLASLHDPASTSPVRDSIKSIARAVLA